MSRDAGGADAGNGGREEPGSLAQETARLVTAAHDWFQRSVATQPTARIATGAAECSWCPICLLISRLRSDGGELPERLAELQEAATGIVRSLADLVAAHGTGVHMPHDQSGHGDTSGTGDSQPSPDDVGRPSRVHRIDLTEGA